jgi:hypothetical protein
LKQALQGSSGGCEACDAADPVDLWTKFPVTLT